MSNRQTLSSFNELDAESKLTVTASSVTATSLANDDTAYVRKSFGAGYFSADFEHSFKFAYSYANSTPTLHLWGVTTGTDTPSTEIAAGTGTYIYLTLETTGKLTVNEGAAGSNHATSTLTTISAGNDYFFRICRDEATGTHGTLYVYIYKDITCQVLLEKLGVSLSAKTDFTYLYVLAAYETGSSDPWIICTTSDWLLENHPYALKEMITAIRYHLRETAASFWSDAELTVYINQAIREIAEKTGCIQKTENVTTTYGIRTVSFTGYKVVAVEYMPAGSDSRGRYLRLITPTMAGHVEYNLHDSEPEYWFEQDNAIGIDPIPQGLYVLRLYFTDHPEADLSGNYDVPEIPPAFRHIIILNAVYQAMVKDKKISVALLAYSMAASDMAFHTADKIINIPSGLRNLRSQ